jgi:energy-coupling factor transporter ATP-binding protein EcfA2
MTQSSVRVVASSSISELRLNATAAGQVCSNPFATRFVRPGAMPFLFPAGLDSAALVQRLAASQWRGAIVGPHGSGKSTLLESLCRELEQAGRSVVRITLRNGQHRLQGPVEAAAEQILAIDGYEQLSGWTRWHLARRCRRCHCGLVVTSHRSTRLPELYRTTVDLALVERIVDCLLPNAVELISSDDVLRAFCSHGENVRESLFALYDLYEARTRVGLARL